MSKDTQDNSVMTPSSEQSSASKPRAQWGLIVVVVIIAVAGFWLFGRKGSTDNVQEQTVQVRRGDLMVTVTEGGSIRAKDSIQYKCKVERRRGSVDITILDIVPPGTYVTQQDVDNGMVLVKLDASSLKDQLQEEEMDLASDQESYTAAKEAYDIQIIQNESDVAQAQLEVRFALMDLEKYMGKKLTTMMTANLSDIDSLSQHVSPFLEEVRNDPNLLEGSEAGQELKGYRDDIVLAEGDLRTAESTLAGSEKLHDADYVSDLELERDRLDVVSSQFSQENAQVSLDLFLRYDFPKNAEQYLSDYIEAGRELERTYAECRSLLAQAQAKLNSAQEQLKSQSKYVEELNQQIEYCTIRAIAPGLVIYGTGGNDDRFRAFRGSSGGIIAKGEVVYEGQILISMPDTAEMIAEISVHETEVDKVRPGQPVKIVMDAFPDKVLHGQVLEVAPLPDQQRGWMNPDLKVYETLVSIDGTHDFLRTRMSCKVEILVRRLNDVLLVPIQAVANRGGQKVCYVSSQGGVEMREVTTGAFTDTLVQITGNLEEGEAILLNPPFEDIAGEPAYLREQQSWDKHSGSNVDTQTGAQDDTRPRQDAERKQPSQGQESRPGGKGNPPKGAPASGAQGAAPSNQSETVSQPS